MTHAEQLRAHAESANWSPHIMRALLAGAAALEAQAGQEGEIAIGREALALVRALYQGSAGLDWRAFTEQAAALLSRAGAEEGGE